MPRKSFSTGPTGTNRVSLDAQHLVRYWRVELGFNFVIGLRR